MGALSQSSLAEPKLEEIEGLVIDWDREQFPLSDEWKKTMVEQRRQADAVDADATTP